MVADYSGTGPQVTLETKINGNPSRQQFKIDLLGVIEEIQFAWKDVQYV